MAASSVKYFVSAGLLAGLLAGVAAGMLGLAVIEPRIEEAIAVESGLGHDAHAGRAAAVAGGVEVPREVQKLGLVLATGLYGLAIGGLVALVFVSLRGRTAHRNDLALALSLGAALFAAAVLVPFAKYPANPPGVGDPATIGERTGLYLVLVAGSLVALLAAWRVARMLARGPAWLRSLAFTGTFASLAALLMLFLPSVDEIPSGYPGELVRDFQLASLGLQLTLWTTLAISFAALLERRSRSRSPGAPPRG